MQEVKMKYNTRKYAKSSANGKRNTKRKITKELDKKPQLVENIQAITHDSYSSQSF